MPRTTGDNCLRGPTSQDSLADKLLDRGSMSIVVLCPGCSIRLTLGDDSAGTMFNCPECDGTIRIPPLLSLPMPPPKVVVYPPPPPPKASPKRPSPPPRLNLASSSA